MWWMWMIPIQVFEKPQTLSYQRQMKTQLKTLFASFLLLIALCFGAFASVGEKHALGDFGSTQQHVGQKPNAIQLVSLGNFTSSAKTASECCNATNRTLTQIDNPVDLTNGRSGHILANHRAGAGKPGKTEFPANWDEQRIMHQVSDIATDPSLVRQVDNRGTPSVSGTRDGIDITVTFFPNNHARAGQISSAYPTNVPANPRP